MYFYRDLNMSFFIFDVPQVSLLSRLLIVSTLPLWKVIYEKYEKIKTYIYVIK